MSVDSQIKWDSQTVQTYSFNRSEHVCTTDSVVKLKDNNVMMYNENINIDSTLSYLYKTFQAQKQYYLLF